MIQIIPAIDLMNGRCVRLEQGRFENVKVYPTDPVAKAMEWEKAGFKRLHVVDLDGAKQGKNPNLLIVKEICQKTNLIVDYGGGIRINTDISKLFSLGISYVTIGSMAVNQPQVLKTWMNRYGAEKFILAADVKNGKIAISGWQESTAISLKQLANDYIQSGIQQIMSTDISRDGMLNGVSTARYKELKQSYPALYIIASGGVSSADDIRSLDHAGIDAVITGKALLEGIITPEELLKQSNKD
jgi:phosphoribosylformimino-5-aminoimidazole carboxamide ribotide isomerase